MWERNVASGARPPPSTKCDSTGDSNSPNPPKEKGKETRMDTPGETQGRPYRVTVPQGSDLQFGIPTPRVCPVTP